MLGPRHRLAGTVTSGPSGFRIKRCLGVEEDGETKCLCIARALVIEPEVFCLNEPTTDLDHQHYDIN